MLIACYKKPICNAPRKSINTDKFCPHNKIPHIQHHLKNYKFENKIHHKLRENMKHKFTDKPNL